ncbi:MAG: hypothetical protein OIF55_15395, partial [Amphritea sp.]|nr:hypothetical protein [Amphritea sp.]
GYQPYLTRQQSLLERGILNGFSDLEVVYNNSYNYNRILNVGSLTGFSYLERLVFTVQLVGETELAIFVWYSSSTSTSANERSIPGFPGP